MQKRLESHSVKTLKLNKQESQLQLVTFVTFTLVARGPLETALIHLVMSIVCSHLCNEKKADQSQLWGFWTFWFVSTLVFIPCHENLYLYHSIKNSYPSVPPFPSWSYYQTEMRNHHKYEKCKIQSSSMTQELDYVTTTATNMSTVKIIQEYKSQCDLKSRESPNGKCLNPQHTEYKTYMKVTWFLFWGYL